MSIDVEKAQIMLKPAKKRNWNNRYDRLEHFKRFPNLKRAIKELENQDFVLVRKKSNFTGISLDSSYKKEVVEFIKKQLPHLRDLVK